MAKHRKPEDTPPSPPKGQPNKHFKFKPGKHTKKTIKWPRKDPDKK